MPRLRLMIACFVLPLLAAFTGACKKGSAPFIQDAGDQVAVVGQQLTVQIVAIDADGDDLTFRYDAPGVPDVGMTAAMAEGPDGQGIFTFTPLASQIGSHFFDFYASDGKNEGRLTILIEVRGAVGSGSLPIFRKPLGSGTVLDLEQSDCVDLDIEVEDPDSAEVVLDAPPPIIDGSNLSTSPNGLSGTWSWCPAREQIETSDRWDLALSADDSENPATIKDFIIVIRRRSGAECPGDAPDIDHSPEDFATLQDLEIRAQISDDEGLGEEPLLLYSMDDPGVPVDFSQMTLVQMELVSGDSRDGEWRGFIPNPVAGSEQGEEADIYYLISASDDDDPDGDCDHLSDAPSSGTFNVSVTAEDSGEGAGLCDVCSVDVQCGDEDDLCLPQDGASFCGQGCTGDDECGGNFVCSPEPVDSVDGASARQCIPNAGSCDDKGDDDDDDSEGCNDDDFEDNDTPEDAESLSSGTENGLTLCNDDDDWYSITLSDEAMITATLSGDNPPDMDLDLTTSAGVLIENATSLESDEELTSACLEAGTYLLRVYSFASSSGSYSLGWSADASECGQVVEGTGDCCEDNGTPGCDDDDVEACVCGMDPFCCDTEWDGMCAGTADDDCEACGSSEESGGEENFDCCTNQDSPGCTETAIQDCVCGIDDFCCTDSWDTLCVNLVGSTLCGPACTPDDGDGYCCEDNGTPGCELDAIEECVCAEDDFCCDTLWDSTCVELVDSEDCSTHGCPS